jgi:hypothetical protein
VSIAVWILVRSFTVAETAPEGTQTHFWLFWASMACGVTPLAALGLRRRAGAVDRWVALLTLAVFTTLPKVLRTWGGPLFSDEFGHYYQLQRVATDGLFPAGGNPWLKVVPDFPLLHWLAAGLGGLGVELWAAATTVASLNHVATLVGVAMLVRALSGDTRQGVIAGFLYALQPGWLFFSAQFAYETLGLPLVVWTLWAAIAARRALGRHRQVLLGLAVVGSGLTALAHHFAAVILAVLLVSIWVLGSRPTTEAPLVVRRGDTAATLGGLGLIGAWIASRWANLWDYYHPTLDEGLAFFRAPLGGAGSRAVFAGSPVPAYERWAGMALPFVLLGLCTVAVAVLWPSLRAWRVRLVPVALAASFFASLPLLLVVATSEAAHRWWAYAYLGVAALLAAAVPPLQDWLQTQRPAVGAAVKLSVVTAIAVAAVGGVAAGTTVAYRFPGPAEVGNDARSVSDEARRLAEHLLADEGPGHLSGIRVLADRYTAQQLVGWGLQTTSRPSGGYPAWNLLFATDPNELVALAPMLRNDKVRYVVVDTRMSTDRPRLGYWYNRNEPGAFGDELVEEASLAKFDCSRWSTLVRREGFLSLYRIEVDLLAAQPDWVSHPAGRDGCR